MIGIVKWYDSERGFGVLEGDDEREYFIHFSNQVNRKQRFYENDILTFQPILENNRLSAKKVEPFLDPIAYQHILSQYVTQNQTNSLIGPTKFVKQINKYISKQNDVVKREFSKLNKTSVHNLILKEFESYPLLETKTHIKELEYKFNSHIDKYVLIEEDINWLKAILTNHIRNHSSATNQVQVYLLGYIDSLPDEEIIKHFYEGERSDQVLLLIKSKDQPTLQATLIEGHLDIHGINPTFTLLQDYLNKVRSGWFAAKHLYDEAYWKDNTGKTLRDIFVKFCENIEDPKTQCDLYLRDFLQKPNIQYLILHPTYYDQSQIKKLFNTVFISKDDIYKYLVSRIESFEEKKEGKDSYYNQLKDNSDLAIEFLDTSLLEKYNHFVNDIFSDDQLIDAWLRNIVPGFPLEVFMNKTLTDATVYKAIAKKFILKQNKNGLLEILLQRLQLLNSTSVNDRPEFYNKYWTIYSLFFLDQTPERSDFGSVAKNRELIPDLIDLKNQFYNLILWSLDLIDDFEIDALRDMFIYFYPVEQIYILRKLIWLNAIKKRAIPIDDLFSLKRVSSDIYRLNEKFNGDIGLDVTVDFILTCLFNYSKENKFFFERDIFDILFNNTRKNPKADIQIKDVFETCKGRSSPKLNFRFINNNSRTITRERFLEDEESSNGGNDFVVRFQYNEDLVSEIRKIPGAHWNKENKYWEVPSQSEAHLVQFGRAHTFSFNISGKEYRDNYYMAEYNRESIPDGITFCEGRMAKIPDDLSQKVFYWCCNNKCFDLCETVHQEDNWREYNFLDFCRIYGLNVNENGRDGLIPNGEYYKLVGQINRFNRLLGRLHCTDCNHLLHPVESGNFTFYRVIRFHCQNQDCSNRSIIYLHHCFNGKCNSIIDSRVSKQCSNKWYICETCTSCCSHRSNATRLKNLETTGGYIHPELKRQVDTHAGHWEKNDHFCYRDSSLMIYEGANQYKCPKCGLERDITPYLTLSERVKDET